MSAVFVVEALELTGAEDIVEQVLLRGLGNAGSLGVAIDNDQDRLRVWINILLSALETISRNARVGSTIVIESSVVIGMTRELLGPLALAQGFFVGMSPERVDPGHVSPSANSIPKVVSGLDDLVPGSLDRVARLDSTVFERGVKASKPEVAEINKL